MKGERLWFGQSQTWYGDRIWRVLSNHPLLSGVVIQEHQVSDLLDDYLRVFHLISKAKNWFRGVFLQIVHYRRPLQYIHFFEIKRDATKKTQRNTVKYPSWPITHLVYRIKKNLSILNLMDMSFVEIKIFSCYFEENISQCIATEPTRGKKNWGAIAKRHYFL